MLLYRHNEHVDRPVGGGRGALLTISRGNASSSSSSSTHSLDSASFTSEQQSTNLFAKLEICVKRKCRFRAGRSVVVSARPLEVLAPFLLSLFFDFSTNLKTTPPFPPIEIFFLFTIPCTRFQHVFIIYLVRDFSLDRLLQPPPRSYLERRGIKGRGGEKDARGIGEKFPVQPCSCQEEGRGREREREREQERRQNVNQLYRAAPFG